MDNNTTPSYSAMVAAARLAARDTLRARNIHKWVRENASLESLKTAALKEIQAFKDSMLLSQKELDRREYALTKLDTTDPDFADKEAAAKKSIAKCTEVIANEEVALANLVKNVTKANAEIDAEIAENKAKIKRWEDGTNKVQLSNLNDLARQYLEIAMEKLAVSSIMFTGDQPTVEAETEPTETESAE